MFAVFPLNGKHLGQKDSIVIKGKKTLSIKTFADTVLNYSKTLLLIILTVIESKVVTSSLDILKQLQLIFLLFVSDRSSL